MRVSPTRHSSYIEHKADALQRFARIPLIMLSCDGSFGVKEEGCICSRPFPSHTCFGCCVQALFAHPLVAPLAIETLTGLIDSFACAAPLPPRPTPESGNLRRAFI